MLVSVTFEYVADGSAGREISEEEGNYSLIPSSTRVEVCLRLKAVWVSSSNCFLVASTSLSVVSWGLFGFLYCVLGSVCSLSCVRFGHCLGMVSSRDGMWGWFLFQMLLTSA